MANHEFDYYVDTYECTFALYDRASPEHVLPTLIPRPVTEEMPASDLFEWAMDAYTNQGRVAAVCVVGTVAGMTMSYEPNGWLASDGTILAAAANGGTAVSSFVNVNAVSSVHVVRDGTLLRAFDPLIYGPGSGLWEGRVMPEEDDLAFGDPAFCRQDTLEFVRRIIGGVPTAADFLEAATNWRGLGTIP